MTLKNYFKLLFHVVVALLIIISLPIALCMILYNKIPGWSVIVLSLLSGSVTMFFGLKYVEFIVWTKDLFKDVF